MKLDTASSGIKREKDDSDEEVTIIPQSQLRPDQLKSIKPDPESPALQQSFKLEGGNHHRGPHYRHREREGRWRSRSRSPSPRRKRHSRLPRHIISDAHMLNTYVISSTHTLESYPFFDLMILSSSTITPFTKLHSFYEISSFIKSVIGR